MGQNLQPAQFGCTALPSQGQCSLDSSHSGCELKTVEALEVFPLKRSFEERICSSRDRKSVV